MGSYWLYSAIRSQNGQDINFSGVVKSDSKYFPLRKVMETHLLVVGLWNTTIGNAVEISEEDYNYFCDFAKKTNIQQMLFS